MTLTPKETHFKRPAIAPVPENVHRPLWSVMIPTFNCANYLRQTLQSVLAQDPGPERMQIEVVDDRSTKDDPEAVVQELGRGRVTFYRKPANAGAIANFNTCIERSRGHLVHILHGDDYVLPGFYSTIEQRAQQHPEVSLLATRIFVVDEDSVIMDVSERVPSLEKGGRDESCFFQYTPVIPPGTVIRRRFYEEQGGFTPDLAHVADWEMWTRAVSEGGGLVTSDVLACYRTFAANDTGRLMRSADNLRDYERLYQFFAVRYPAFDKKAALNRLSTTAWNQALRFESKNDQEAARANWNYWREKTPLSLRTRFRLKHWVRKLV